MIITIEREPSSPPSVTPTSIAAFDLPCRPGPSACRGGTIFNASKPIAAADLVFGLRSDFDYKDYKSKAKLPKVFDYYMDLGGLEPGRFAMEEFNKRKNAQLQLVRVIKSQRHLLRTGISSLYLITLEAVDAGVAKLYQARIFVNFTEGMILEWFCLLVDDGCPIALFDHLENFFVLKDNEDRADNQIPMCKRQGSGPIASAAAAAAPKLVQAYGG